MTSFLRPTVHIDLSRVCARAEEIARETRVPVIAVIKAQAYGLGAREIVRALSDVVSGFYCFSLQEAIDAQTAQTGRTTVAFLAPDDAKADDFRTHNVRPVVWDIERAARLRAARPVLAVDTGMQRLAAPPENIDAIITAGACDEAFTHATRVEHAKLLQQLCGRRGMRLHAAASSLLDCPEARLDAVRPGLALYRNAVRVTTRLLEARDSRGPIGYGSFVTSTGRHGVIAGGFTTGVNPGLCSINGERRAIIESGMQTSFVEIGPTDRAGDEVVLLGDEVPLEAVGAAWSTTPHEALWRMSSCGNRVFD